MALDDILSSDISRKKRRRVGRGIGSGLGKTCGRGTKGEGSRTGGKNRGPLFEGGQFPFWMRLPKRGFTNLPHKVERVALRLADVLARVRGDAISAESLAAAGIVRLGKPVKLVSGGDVKVDRKLTVSVPVTASVRQAIEAAGGTVSGTQARE